MRLKRAMQRNPSRNAWRTGLKSMTIAYPLQKPNSGYTRGRLESMSGLPDQTPVRMERPVYQQPATNEIFLWHRSPKTAVVTVVTVVAHGEVAVLRNGECLVRLGQIIAAFCITIIAKLRRHYASKAVSLRQLPINIE